MMERSFRFRPMALWLLGVTALAFRAAPAHSEAVSQATRQELDSGETAGLAERVAFLESALSALQKDYDSRLAELEQRLAVLEETSSGRESPPAAEQGQEALSDEERAELESELASILEDTEGEVGGASQEPSAGERRFTGRTRTLTELNPEISVTGDVFGTVADRTGDPEANQFRLAEFEMAFQSPLDPFSLAKAFVVQEEGEFEVEEAYIEWPALPGGIGVKVGQVRHDWGKLNRWHQHALPQADRPLVHQAVFGEEGLKGLGATLSWLPPTFLGDYNELWVQVTNDENDVAFSGRGYDEPVFLLHETNYWDLSTAAYLEVGLSAATGVNDPFGRFRTQVYGVDWNLDWRPPAQALYKGLELRGELLWERREGEGESVDTLGAYTFATYKLNRRWFVGFRADWTELPQEPGESLWGISPYVEWWQSEWARLRFQYSHHSRQLEEGEGENLLFFQVTWALGPHKHEKY